MGQPGARASTRLVTPQGSVPVAVYDWLENGSEFFRRLLRGIEGARESVRLEVYIFSNDPVGIQIRDALLAAVRRGVQVRVLLDALGSNETANRFWDDFQRAGGGLRWFNPLRFPRWPIRNHRKLLVIDDRVAGVGGFNVAEQYVGDGVQNGWADVGLALTGPAVVGLAAEFDRMWTATERPEGLRGLFRLGNRQAAKAVAPDIHLLAMGPGRSPGAFQTALRRDVGEAKRVLFAVAYFVPTWSMRQMLRQAAARGARVRIIVPAMSDVALASRAARHLYDTLFRKGVEIYEYQPQMLHVKLYVTDTAAYVGSSNLDTRSLYINHELMLRLTGPDVVRQAWELGEALGVHSQRVDPARWRHSRGMLEKFRDRLAYWILARADPYVARWLVRQPR